MHIPCQLGCRNALHSLTAQTPDSSCHGEAENHIPRSLTPTHKQYTLNSETDPGLRSATPMLTQRQQHTCTRRAALTFRIGGGRESIRQYFVARGGSCFVFVRPELTAGCIGHGPITTAIGQGGRAYGPAQNGTCLWHCGTRLGSEKGCTVRYRAAPLGAARSSAQPALSAYMEGKSSSPKTISSSSSPSSSGKRPSLRR